MSARIPSCGSPIPDYAYGVTHTRPVQISGRHFNADNLPLSEEDRQLAGKFAGEEFTVDVDALRAIGGL